MRKTGLIAACAVLAAGFLTAACTERAYEFWNRPHVAEGEGFGDANRQIYAQQIVDPDPVKPTAEEAAVDGARTQKSVTAYKNKEVTAGAAAAVTAGGGAGGGGATGAAVPAK